MSDRILVTGGAGFVGSSLVRRLLEDGCEVSVVDNHLSGPLENLASVRDSIRFVEGDVNDAELLARVFREFRPQHLYHLVGDTFVPSAYRQPERFVRVNIDGTLSVLRAAARFGLERMLYVSSTEVYGRVVEQPIREDAPLAPVNTYAVTKLAADRLCHTFHLEHDVPVVIGRIFNCYGPRETQPYVVPEIIRQLDRGREVMLGELRARRDLTYVDDTARGLMALMASDLPNGEATNIGSGESIDMASLVMLCAAIMGRDDVQLRSDPKRMRRFEIEDFRCDARRIHQATGWRPELSLELGLERTISWYREHGSRWSWEIWCQEGVVD